MSDKAKEKPPVQAAAEEKPSWLDRRLDLTGVDPPVWIFILLLIVAVLLRFWDLGARAMHHDESIHAWLSYQFYTGEQLYRYDPAFHGPLLYHVTALFYFLFGDSDAIARAPEALFGLLLVAACYPLRRWLGRWGWLIAAALLAFSPAFVYFSRFARHDALVATLTLAVVIFLFRYLEERHPRDLVLSAAALALAFASHELTFIVVFILVSFLGLAYLLDRQGKRIRTDMQAAAGALFLFTFILQAVVAQDPSSSPALRTILIAIALLGLGYLLLSIAWRRLFWEGPSPVRGVVDALAKDPRALLTALGVFGVIFAVLFTTFLTNPRGFLDGLVQGVGYWTGQHDVARGGQPWFYYLMLLPVYEPIALTGGVAGLFVALLARRRKSNAPAEGAPVDEPAPALFPLFLVYWAIFAAVLFSWAGERMPWLLLHVALPLVLLAGLALERFAGWMKTTRHTLWRSSDWAIAPLFLLLALALTGLVRLLQGQVPHPLADQYRALQAGVLIVICVGLIALLAWRIYRVEGRHLAQSFAALGLLLLALYTIRSTFLLNFYNGDTPKEMLVYTQTAPDVPLAVREIERIGIDQTRKTRTTEDPTGGHGLKVAIDSSRDAGLEWPFDWYLRAFARAGTLSTFDGTQAAPQGADIILLLADNEPNLHNQLLGKYTGMRLKHRWWFPEYETYKRWVLLGTETTPQGYQTMPWLNPWTYSRDGVVNLWNYFTFRQLPYALSSQDFFFYVRTELLPSGGTVQETDPYIAKLTTKVATQRGVAGSGAGQLSGPRGVAIDVAGNIYVADSGNHRIVVFNALGTSFSWGSYCNLTTEAKEGCIDPDDTGPLPLGAGQFNEPWGVAVDTASGRVYVADTWNHRIQAFDAAGNFLGQWGNVMLVDADAVPGGRLATPFGFYGPRGLAVDGEGRVYVTDTGNERVLVYTITLSTEGTVQAGYAYQWGTMGPDTGQFLEPVGIAVDGAGWVYVADTLNGRVQVFAPGADGVVSPVPTASWPVTGWDSTSRENKPYLAVGAGGQVCFAVPERNYVACTDSTGKVLSVWNGNAPDGTPFNLPVGVAADAQGQVVVSDSGNGRVLVFTLP